MEIITKKKKASIDEAIFIGRIGEQPIYSFEFTTPVDYIHWNQLDRFYGKNYLSKRNFVIYSKIITDRNYCFTTNKLEPGVTYTVDLYPIIKRVKGTFCLLFLEYKQSLRVGPQFGSLIWSIDNNHFPKDVNVAFFDRKEALYRHRKNSNMVTFIHRDCDGLYWDFAAEELEGTFNDHFVIPVVRKKS